MSNPKSMMDEWIRDEIKNRISLFEFAHCGPSGRVACPFRDCPAGDRQETWIKDDFFFCHVCKRRGDIFDWLQLTEGLEYAKAKRFLAERIGLSLAPNKDRSKLLMQVVQAAHRYLFETAPEKLAYLENRAIPKNIAFKFQLGYIDLEGKALESSGLSHEDLLKLGVYYPKRHGDDEDRLALGGRYIFPIRDLAGRIVQLKGRADPKVLGDDVKKSLPLQKKPPKSPDAWGEVPHSDYLYLEERLEKARTKGYVIVCEGEPDTLTMQSLRFHAVGLQTSQGMLKHAHKLKGFERVYLFLDNDVASQRMLTKELYDLQTKLPNTAVFRVMIPNLLGTKEDGKPIKVDVNDYVAKMGKGRKDIELLLRQAESAYDVIVKDWGKEYGERQRFAQLADLICQTKGKQKDHLLNLFAEATGKPKDLLAFAIDPAGKYHE